MPQTNLTPTARLGMAIFAVLRFLFSVGMLAYGIFLVTKNWTAVSLICFGFVSLALHIADYTTEKVVKRLTDDE